MTHKIVVPFKSWHYDWLSERSAPGEGYTMSLDKGTVSLLETLNSWTCVADGDPVMCGGTMQHWPGRHTAWTYLSEDSGPHMLWITRQTRRVLADVKGRMEFTVRKDFAAGHTFARLLGFEVETPCLKAYGPFGEDHVGYLRMN